MFSHPMEFVANIYDLSLIVVDRVNVIVYIIILPTLGFYYFFLKNILVYHFRYCV